MAREVIHTGFAPNDGQGDAPRDAAGKINRMTAELYALVAALTDSKSPVLRAIGELILQRGVVTLTTDGAEIAPIGAAGRQLLALDDVAELADYADLQPADADLTAIAAQGTTAFGRSLLAAVGQPAALAAIGAQPADADLSAIAALATTVFGRALLTLADQPAALAAIGAQPIDADLSAIAALTTTPLGRSLLTGVDGAAIRALIGLGSASLATIGTAAGNALQLDGNAKVPTANLPEAILGAMRYQGTWNAATNAPAIVAPTTAATKGFYYVVGTAGATSVSGIADWKVGDWIVSNGATWDKVDSSDQVNSVAGLLGTITAADLRTALGLVIGQTVQAQDTDLDAIAALVTTAFGRGLLTLADGAALRTAAGTRIGQDVQAYSGLLASIAGSAATSSLFYRDAAGNFQPLALGNGLSISANALVAAGGGGGASTPAPDVQVFNSSGTWTKPANAVRHDIYALSPGGGGGSGRKGPAGTDRTGGGGGSPGWWSAMSCLSAALGATETVSIGAGGQGGPAQTTNSTNGSFGSNGGSTSFGAHLFVQGNTSSFQAAYGGSTGGASGGGSSGAIGMYPGFGGQSSTLGTPFPQNAAINGALGGSAGASINAADTVFPAGQVYNRAAGWGGSLLPLVAGAAGGDNPSVYQPGVPGTGGSASKTAGTPGQAGGKGGAGAGGGGGGAGTDGVADSGKGGDGGNGRVVVITYFA